MEADKCTRSSASSIWRERPSRKCLPCSDEKPHIFDIASCSGGGTKSGCFFIIPPSMAMQTISRIFFNPNSKFCITKKRYRRNSSGASHLTVISAATGCSPILLEKRSFISFFLFTSGAIKICHILTTKIHNNFETAIQIAIKML